MAGREKAERSSNRDKAIGMWGDKTIGMRGTVQLPRIVLQKCPFTFQRWKPRIYKSVRKTPPPPSTIGKHEQHLKLRRGALLSEEYTNLGRTPEAVVLTILRPQASGGETRVAPPPLIERCPQM